MRKRCLFQYIKMMVLGDNIFCPGSNGAVHKFIVVGVGFYQFESEMRVDISNIRSRHDEICHRFGSTFADVAGDYLDILLDNFVGDT